jgi:pyrroline-5-carboxylate reductase
MKLGFIGTGNMAVALIKSMKKGNEVISSDKNQEKLQKAENGLGIKATTDNNQVAKNSEIIFLCAKPNNIEDILQEIKSNLKNEIIVSIAAGIKIKFIENIIGKDKKVIRVMPNLNCFVGEMAAAFACNNNIEVNEKEKIRGLLNKAGFAFEIDEEKMDAVTALSGSGPAFIAYILETFTQAAEKEGLENDVAYDLALQTFFGTSKLLKETKENSNDFIKKVASKGGTTEAGLKVLENSHLKKIIEKTIATAAKRSKELGK